MKRPGGSPRDVELWTAGSDAQVEIKCENAKWLHVRPRRHGSFRGQPAGATVTTDEGTACKLEARGWTRTLSQECVDGSAAYEKRALRPRKAPSADCSSTTPAMEDTRPAPSGKGSPKKASPPKKSSIPRQGKQSKKKRASPILHGPPGGGRWLRNAKGRLGKPLPSSLRLREARAIHLNYEIRCAHCGNTYGQGRRCTRQNGKKINVCIYCYDHAVKAAQAHAGGDAMHRAVERKRSRG